MEKESLYQTIEDFLDGQLSTEDQAAFEKQLANDIALKKEVKLHQTLHNTLGDAQADAFANQLKALGTQYTETPNKKFRFKWYWLAAAASVILIGSWFVYQQTQKTSPQNLFVANFQPYPLSNKQRSDVQTQFTDYQKGLKAYQAKAYTEALIAFGQGAKPQPPLIRLLMGICMLELDNATGAIDILQNLSQDHKHIYQNEAKWYLALAYLANDQPQKSYVLFKELSVLRSKVGEQANDLLEELE